MPKAMAPLDLLRELQTAYRYDGLQLRRKQERAQTELDRRAISGRAYACEQAVLKIEATLRDWA